MINSQNKDIKPLLEWAQSQSEAKIVDRVLLKLMLELLSSNTVITEQMIQDNDTCYVTASLYERFLSVTQELVGKTFHQGANNV